MSAIARRATADPTLSDAIRHTAVRQRLGLAPIFWTHFFDDYSCVDPFVFHRGVITQSAVEPFWVIEGFDVIKYGQLGLVMVKQLAVVEAFGLERAPEGLHGGVVITMSLGAHAGADAVRTQ